MDSIINSSYYPISLEQYNFYNTDTFYLLTGGPEPGEFPEFGHYLLHYVKYFQYDIKLGHLVGKLLRHIEIYINSKQSSSDLEKLVSFYDSISFIPFRKVVYSFTAEIRGIRNGFTKKTFIYLVNAFILDRLLLHFIEYYKAPTPTSVNSFYRTPTLNKSVNGALKSRHLVARAVDLGFATSSDCRDFLKLLSVAPFFRYYYRISDKSLHVDI